MPCSAQAGSSGVGGRPQHRTWKREHDFVPSEVPAGHSAPAEGSYSPECQVFRARSRYRSLGEQRLSGGLGAFGIGGVGRDGHISCQGHRFCAVPDHRSGLGGAQRTQPLYVILVNIRGVKAGHLPLELGRFDVTVAQEVDGRVGRAGGPFLCLGALPVHGFRVERHTLYPAVTPGGTQLQGLAKPVGSLFGELLQREHDQQHELLESEGRGPGQRHKSGRWVVRGFPR